MEQFTGKVWLLGDDIDTDIIIPTEYLALKTVKDMAPYGFSPLRNFGCGSSREQAPEVIKALGVRAVIARSYARIFFRNAINNGLLLIENDTLCNDVKEGDEITVNVGKSIEYNGKTYPISALPDNLLDILKAGGLVKAMQKLNGIIK